MNPDDDPPIRVIGFPKEFIERLVRNNLPPPPMSDTVKISDLAPGYRYSTQELGEAINAGAAILKRLPADFQKSNLFGKLWKLVKLIWATRKELSVALDGVNHIPAEVIDMNAEEVHKLADDLWDRFGDGIGPKGQMYFEESFSVLIAVTRAVRRFQNTYAPPKAIPLPE